MTRWRLIRNTHSAVRKRQRPGAARAGTRQRAADADTRRRHFPQERLHQFVHVDHRRRGRSRNRTAASSITLGQGQFFGEMSLLSGRRRSATVRASARLRAARNAAPRNDQADEQLRAGARSHRPALHHPQPCAPISYRTHRKANWRPSPRPPNSMSFRAGEVLFREGDEADGLHLIRSGSVSVSRHIGGRDIVTSYVAAGNYVGEMGLVGETRRSATVTATVATESVFLRADIFQTTAAAQHGTARAHTDEGKGTHQRKPAHGSGTRTRAT